MCGRFTLVTDPDKLVLRFHIEVIPFEWQARYNIAPGQNIPAIIEDKGQRRIGQLKWGLVPSWASDAKGGFKLINAFTLLQISLPECIMFNPYHALTQ